MTVLYILFESASGYALFECTGIDSIGNKLYDITSNVTEFSNYIKLKAFQPFSSAEDALTQINSISEGEPTIELLNFIEHNLIKDNKKSKYELGVSEAKLGAAIGEVLSIKCKYNDIILELLRGIRLHISRYITILKSSDLYQAQLGLSHSYSRSKVKFNVHRVDNMIIQSIALLDQLDKDLNTFSMRVKEWYGWHYPELAKLVNDNYQYAQLCVLIKNRSNETIDALRDEMLVILAHDDTRVDSVIESAKHSMGQDLSIIDMINIQNFAERVVELSRYRKSLHQYLLNKMNITAPNLSALIGELVGARLIAHAGSLTSLAKYPASTVQILGAEKALFRALKTKGNTPKYGLIYHSSFIGRAASNVKGRISRYLANKCSIATRIDTFSDGQPTNIYGTVLKQQVEDRLEFYRTGAQPKKNIDVMSDAMKQIASSELVEVDDVVVAAVPGSIQGNQVDVNTNQSKSKKSKKDKKGEKRVASGDEIDEKIKSESKKSKKSKKSKL